MIARELIKEIVKRDTQNKLPDNGEFFYTTSDQMNFHVCIIAASHVVEFFVCHYLVKISPVDKPYLAGIAHNIVVSEKPVAHTPSMRTSCGSL